YEVAHAAYKVIEGKGATNYAIGLSATRIAEAVLRDEHAVMPVSTVLNDYHGLSDVALSVPHIVGSTGATPILEAPFSEDELALLHQSADAIKATLAEVRK